MSDSNRVQMSIGVESAYGAPTDLSATAFTALRITSESLAAATAVTQSQELRADRQVAFVARTGFNAAGDINWEMSYGAHDEMLRGLLQSAAWSAPVTRTATTISAASGDNSINDSGNGLGGFAVGAWVRIVGFTGANAANNGLPAKVVSVAAGKLVLSGITLVTDAAGESVTVYQGAQVVNGTTLTTYAIQRKYDDLTNVWALYRGMAPNTGAMNITADGIIAGSFGMLGKSEESKTAAQGSGIAAAAANDPMTGVDNVPMVYLDGASYPIAAATVSAQNNLRGRQRVGNLGPYSLGSGTFVANGTLNAYFDDATQHDKYLSFANVSLAFWLRDSALNSYIVEFPRAKLTQAKRAPGGLNTDVMSDIAWSAFRHPTEDVTMRIVRMPHP